MDTNLSYWVITLCLAVPATIMHYYGKIWGSLLNKGLDSEVPPLYSRMHLAYKTISFLLVLLIFFIGPLFVFDYLGSYRIYGKPYTELEISQMSLLMRWAPPVLFQMLWAICLFCCWSLICIQFFAFKAYKEKIVTIAENSSKSPNDKEEFIRSMLDDNSDEVEGE